MKGQVTEESARESRSLTVAMGGFLFMGVAGVVAGVLANSTAVLLDGLFSVLGFLSALIGRWVSRRIGNPPDRLRPMGYAAEEALFTTLRSLAILVLIPFFAGSAALRIFAYVRHGEATVLNFGPAIVYFAVIGLTCFALCVTHRRNWILTGRRSDILRVEARATLFDGLLTSAIAAGILAVYLLQDGILSPIAPIGDALIVVILCVAVAGKFWKDFMAGLVELAGGPARPEALATARRAARPVLAEAGGRVRDFSLMKMGRSYWALVHYDPGRPVLAGEIDALQRRLTAAMEGELKTVEVAVLVSERTRGG